jgi:hypothetical protein
MIISIDKLITRQYQLRHIVHNRQVPRYVILLIETSQSRQFLESFALQLQRHKVRQTIHVLAKISRAIKDLNYGLEGESSHNLPRGQISGKSFIDRFQCGNLDCVLLNLCLQFSTLCLQFLVIAIDSEK